MEWVDELLQNLQNAYQSKIPVKVQDEAGEVLINVKQELIDLVNQSRPMLIKVGKDTFKQYLILMHRAQEFDALITIYAKLDGADLMTIYKQDAMKFSQLASEVQSARDFWRWFGKQVGMRIFFGVIGALIP